MELPSCQSYQPIAKLSNQPQAPEPIASIARTASAKAPLTALICHVIDFTPSKIPN